MKIYDDYEYIEPFTDREVDILRLKVKRQSNKEIANTLSLSHNTVRWYISQIYAKIDVKDRAELIQRVNELGLLDANYQGKDDSPPTVTGVLLEHLTQREQEILQLLNQGLTNDQIAVSLTIAVGTVKSHVHNICQKLGVKNRLQAVIVAKRFGLLITDKQSQSVTSHYQLPKRWTSFIGRQTEIQEIIKELEDTRLLTLTGAGGTGKTRLALVIAEQVQNRYADGVFFVDLSSIRDQSDVLNIIATTLGLIESQTEPLQETIQRALQQRHMLMILDNFEHVLAATFRVIALLQATSYLTILVTSREPLQIYGEHEYSLLPLPIPIMDKAQDLLNNEAIQLFIQRAQAVNHRLYFSHDNIETISEICTRLDGLPLAIELAAARTKTLTPSAILERLDQRLDLLTKGARDLPERQQTIRNTILWSYDLLSSDEQRLFMRLAVFRGGRSIEACEAICGDDLALDTLDGLSSLVNKSLLIQHADRLGEPRFFMLETVQEFAWEQLKLAGETDVTLLRHATYFSQLAVTNEFELRGANQRYWFERFEIEMDNIRVALRHTLIEKRQPEVGIHLLCALFDVWWWWNAHHSEADRWLHIGLKFEKDLPLSLHARLYVMAGYAGWRLRRDFETCYHNARIAHEISIELNDKWLMAWTLRYMGGSYIVMPAELATTAIIETARDYVMTSINLFLELGDRAHAAHSYNTVGQLFSMLGQNKKALESYEKCIDLAYEVQDLHRVQMNMMNVSRQKIKLGDIQQAEQISCQALVLARELNSPYMLAMAILDVASFTTLDKSIRLLARLNLSLNQFGTIFQIGTEEFYNNVVAKVQAQLDGEAYDRLWSEGQTLSVEEAVAYALDEIDPFNDAKNETEQRIPQNILNSMFK